MTGIRKSEQHIVKQAEPTIVTIGHKMLHSPIDVLLVIQRLHFVFLSFLLMRILTVNLLVIHAHVLLLNKGRVGKHKRTEVTCSRGAIYIALETHFDDVRNQTRVVYVGVAEYHAIQFGGVESQIAIGGIRLQAFTLIHTTIQ